MCDDDDEEGVYVYLEIVMMNIHYLVACLLLLASSMSGLDGASATDGLLVSASSVATTGLCRGEITPSTPTWPYTHQTNY